MKTLLTDLIRTEHFLRNQLGPEESLIFQARLQVDTELKQNTMFHRMVHRLVSLYERRRMKTHLEGVYQRMANDPKKLSLKEHIHEFLK